MGRSPLDLLSEDVFHLLTAYEFFADVPVFLIREGTPQSEIDKAIAAATKKGGKMGASVLVIEPVFDNDRPSASGGAVLTPALTVRVLTMPQINNGTQGTKKTGFTITQAVVQVVNQFQAVGLYGALSGAKEFITKARDDAREVYDVVWHTIMPLQKIGRAPMPNIIYDGNAQTVSFACADSEAAIYYTFDDSMPRWAMGGVAANGALYAGAPVSVAGQASDFFVRAAAFKAGWLPSIPNRILVPGVGALMTEGDAPIVTDGDQQIEVNIR